MRVRWSGLVVVLAVFLWSSNAFADAIVITSGGGFTYWDGDSGGFQLTGSGTQISFDHHGNATDAFHSGATVVIHDSVAPVPYSTFARTATVKGTYYSSVFLYGSLDLLGAPFVAPAAPMNTFRDFSTSFTMNGHLIGCATPGTFNGTAYVCGGSTLFSEDFTGSGIASTGPLRALDDGSGGTTWLNRNGDNFAFSDPGPSPTPEPATLLLLATGLAAGARRFRMSKS
jgi:hypothetical protein